MTTIAADPQGQLETLNRVEHIDLARGLFVVWMVTAHGLTLAGIPTDHWLQWLRPKGWATVGFVMLSGYLLGAVYGARPGLPDGLQRRLLRRAVQLAAIAYLSNLAAKVLEAWLGGREVPVYALRVATFQEPWSISGVLVPIALALLVGYAALRVLRETGAWVGFGALTLLNVGLHSTRLVDPSVAPSLGLVSRLLDYSWPFSFPVVEFLLAALWALSLGLVYSRSRLASRPTLRWIVTGTALGIVVVANQWQVPFSPIAFRFYVSLAAAQALSELPQLAEPLRAVLRVMGQAALAVFIGHRPIMQLLHMTSRHRMPDRETEALVLISVGLSGCLALAYARSRSPVVSRVLQRVGF